MNMGNKLGNVQTANGDIIGMPMLTNASLVANLLIIVSLVQQSTDVSNVKKGIFLTIYNLNVSNQLKIVNRFLKTMQMMGTSTCVLSVKTDITRMETNAENVRLMDVQLAHLPLNVPVVSCLNTVLKMVRDV